MASNPIKLAPRFEIRKLEPNHHDWAKAILTHSSIFSSPLWTAVLPDNQNERAYDLFHAVEYIVAHSIDSGLSYGVFDTQYQFKYPDSVAHGGKLHWDVDDTSATGELLLAQMDFPLVAIALSYDGFKPYDKEKVEPLMQAMPLYRKLSAVLEERDARDPAARKVEKAGEVLVRSGTSTRAGYEGMGLTKGLAHWLMYEMRERGFRGVQIKTTNEVVDRIWMNPPGGMKAELVAEVKTGEYEEEMEGRMVRVFAPAEMRCTVVYVKLV